MGETNGVAYASNRWNLSLPKTEGYDPASEFFKVGSKQNRQGRPSQSDAALLNVVCRLSAPVSVEERTVGEILTETPSRWSKWCSSISSTWENVAWTAGAVFSNPMATAQGFGEGLSQGVENLEVTSTRIGEAISSTYENVAWTTGAVFSNPRATAQGFGEGFGAGFENIITSPLRSAKEAIMDANNQRTVMDAFGVAGEYVGGIVQSSIENSLLSTVISGVLDNASPKTIENYALPFLEKVTGLLESFASIPTNGTRAIVSTLNLPTATRLVFEDVALAATNRTGRFLSGDSNFTAVRGRIITEKDFSKLELEAIRQIYIMTKKEGPTNRVWVASLHNPGMGTQWQYARLEKNPRFSEAQTPQASWLEKLGLPTASARDNLVNSLGGFMMEEDYNGNVIVTDTYDFKDNISEIFPLTRDSDPKAASNKVCINLGKVTEDNSADDPAVVKERMFAEITARKHLTGNHEYGKM
ncbi:MAG: hypothetical protein PHN47_08465 [Clostridia bacterium]|nr:hypothetical protein [Clostridia bacterium]